MWNISWNSLQNYFGVRFFSDFTLYVTACCTISFPTTWRPTLCSAPVTPPQVACTLRLRRVCKQPPPSQLHSHPSLRSGIHCLTMSFQHHPFSSSAIRWKHGVPASCTAILKATDWQTDRLIVLIRGCKFEGEKCATDWRAQDSQSHRVIEKRRRDRINSYLADLGRLVVSNDCDGPSGAGQAASKHTAGHGRIKKTDIIEMAIERIRHLQAQLLG